MELSDNAFVARMSILGKNGDLIDSRFYNNPSFDRIISDIGNTMISKIGKVNFSAEVSEDGKTINLKSGLAKGNYDSRSAFHGMFAEVRLEPDGGISTRIDYAAFDTAKNNYSSELEYLYSWYDSEGIEIANSSYSIYDKTPSDLDLFNEEYYKAQLKKRNPLLTRDRILSSEELFRYCTESSFRHSSRVDSLLGTILHHRSFARGLVEGFTHKGYSDVLPHENPNNCHRIGQLSEISEVTEVDKEELIKNELAYFRRLLELANNNPSRFYDILLKRVRKSLKSLGINPDEYGDVPSIRR